MNPSNREIGPAPGAESQPNPEQVEEAKEAGPALPEKKSAIGQPPVIAMPQDLPQAADPVIPGDDNIARPVASPPAKDHVDIRPWVDKTKGVIASTKDDPFVQKKEISKVKAEYIKNRFNKVIKAEDSA